MASDRDLLVEAADTPSPRDWLSKGVGVVTEGSRAASPRMMEWLTRTWGGPMGDAAGHPAHPDPGRAVVAASRLTYSIRKQGRRHSLLLASKIPLGGT